MDYVWNWHDGMPMGVFGFVIIIVLLNGLFSVMRTRAKQDVLREAIKSGQSIDPAVLKSLQDSDDGDGDGSGVLTGLILMAVAVGIVFFGYQLEKVEADEQIFDIFLGIAGIPFLIGVVLFIAGLFRRGKQK